jgi:hypothetical protein
LPIGAAEQPLKIVFPSFGAVWPDHGERTPATTKAFDSVDPVRVLELERAAVPPPA